MKEKNTLEENLICDEYINTKIGIEALALKYHVGKKKIKAILDANNIKTKSKGGQRNNETFVVDDIKSKKYVNTDEYHYVVKDIKTGWKSNDINNSGGVLTSYIKRQYSINIPSLYDRQKYYQLTGNYWWEQFLTYEKETNLPRKKCPYCDWETIDVTNKSGMFETHLLKAHKISKLTYLKEHPEDREFFRTVNPTIDLQMEENSDNYVVCKICGKKLSKISNTHLKSHNMTKEEYILKFGNDEIMCKNTCTKFQNIAKKININLSEKMKDRFTSKAESEILDFLKSHNIECEKNRTVLHGQELDIYIPSKKIAIEYNGNIWHTEGFGKKDRNYHLSKLKQCNEQNIGLIQICDDEYLEHKDLVLNKIMHIVGIDGKKPKIYARKTEIKQIFKFEADEFLNKYHIQGTARATLYYGCFFEGSLIAVMTFRNGNVKNNGWELTRFASDYHYVCCGVGGKMFKHFLKEQKPEKVSSFADRRWTISTEDNLYTKLGFQVEKILRPDYKYFLSKGGNNRRIHKMSLNKKMLSKKYNLDARLTENEMTKMLGYDRIWDCGLIKYVYTNPNYVDIYSELPTN